MRIAFFATYLIEKNSELMNGNDENGLSKRKGVFCVNEKLNEILNWPEENRHKIDVGIIRFLLVSTKNP